MMPGDVITDGDDNLYKVQSISGGFNGASWQLGARRLGIQDFGHTTLYVGVSSASSDTTDRTVSETPGDPVLSAIQPQAQAVSDEFGTKATPQLFRIWREETVDNIQAGDMFEDEAGVRYEILEVLDRNRIDELEVFECVKKL